MLRSSEHFANSIHVGFSVFERVVKVLVSEARLSTKGLAWIAIDGWVAPALLGDYMVDQLPCR